jgi:hypothetical protein
VCRRQHQAWDKTLNRDRAIQAKANDTPIATGGDCAEHHRRDRREKVLQCRINVRIVHRRDRNALAGIATAGLKRFDLA